MACSRIFSAVNQQIRCENVRSISFNVYNILFPKPDISKPYSPIFETTPATQKAAEVTKETHTGQVFDNDDYRNVRFANATRYVNPNFAIDLIAEEPPKECTERVVCCDGGDSHLGHPKVYINLDKPGPQACGYCGLQYVKKDGHHH